MDPRAQALADLTAPGAAWEVRDEIVVGEKLPVFADRHHSLTALLAACASEYADRDCLVAGDWRITFGALPALITSLAEQLANRYGIGPGDRVAIWAGNAPEWALVFWAAVTRGAIVAACNDRWTADEAAHALADCEPSLLVIDERCRTRFDPSPDSPFAVLALGDVRALAETQPAASLADITAAVDEDDPALILYTSGTTGRAKGALISHRALVGFVHVQLSNVAIGMELARRFGVELPPAEPIRVLMTSPMFHVSGLMAGILLCLGNGDTMIIHQGRFDPAEVLRTIGRQRVTNWAPLGSMGPRVLDALAADPGSYNVDSVRQLGFGGAPLSPTLRQRLLGAFPNVKRSPSSPASVVPSSTRIPRRPVVSCRRWRWRFATSRARRNPRVSKARFTFAARTRCSGIGGTRSRRRRQSNRVGGWQPATSARGATPCCGSTRAPAT
jgi:acyl-CoA synthetase (AMP-forming)/AMP-acid ligase II